MKTARDGRPKEKEEEKRYQVILVLASLYYTVENSQGWTTKRERGGEKISSDISFGVTLLHC